MRVVEGDVPTPSPLLTNSFIRRRNIMIVGYIESVVRTLVQQPAALLVVAWALVFVCGLLWVRR